MLLDADAIREFREKVDVLKQNQVKNYAKISGIRQQNNHNEENGDDEGQLQQKI